MGYKIDRPEANSTNKGLEKWGITAMQQTMFALNDIERRIEDIHAALGTSSAQIESLESSERSQVVNLKIDAINEYIGNIEDNIETMSGAIGTLEDNYTALEARVRALEGSS